MAHYAILDENDIVIDVTTGRDENDTIDGVEQKLGKLTTQHNLEFLLKDVKELLIIQVTINIGMQITHYMLTNQKRFVETLQV